MIVFLEFTMCPQPKAMFFSLARQIIQPYIISLEITSVLLSKLSMAKISEKYYIKLVQELP